ncbi:MAG TPA: hypothetical protein VL371_00560 [Gemmataceae bacterium]|nr:hypothetical protein [Gemmataceae bacterium]
MTSYEEWQKEYEAELERTKRVFTGQREQIRRDYAGQFVGFASGRVIAADTDVNKVIAVMETLNPPPGSAAIFRAEEEPVFEVIEDYRTEFLSE